MGNCKFSLCPAQDCSRKPYVASVLAIITDHMNLLYDRFLYLLH